MTICTYCLMDLTFPSSRLHISYPPGAFGGDTASAAVRQEQLHANVSRQAELIGEALEAGWQVLIDNYIATPPVTTWNGDPVCAVHLYDIAQRDRR